MKNKDAAAGHPIGRPDKKYVILALFGKSGSGKDTIRNKLLELYPDTYQRLVAYTTRPPRIGEVDGQDYYFISPDEFGRLVLNYSMLEATCFQSAEGNWFYGTNINSLSLDKINIGVFNPAAIEILLDDDRLHVIPILIKASDKVKLLRQLNREQYPNCEEVCRRFLADQKDFYDVSFDCYIAINDNEYALETVPLEINNYVDNLIKSSLNKIE